LNERGGERARKRVEWRQVETQIKGERKRRGKRKVGRERRKKS
jgi:hypothetical protein